MVVRGRFGGAGYWTGPGVGDWPDLHRFVDYDWDEEERELIVDYLLRGFVSRAYMGYSPCRICGCDNGALELSDGTYVWPEGLRHYVVEHGVRLPSRFVLHVLATNERLETAERDPAWWHDIDPVSG